MTHTCTGEAKVKLLVGQSVTLSHRSQNHPSRLTDMLAPCLPLQLPDEYSWCVPSLLDNPP